MIEAGGIHRTSLEYKIKEWNVVYIEFSNMENGVNFFQVNNESKTFALVNEPEWDDELFLGGYKEQFLTASIARLDIYSENQVSNENLPQKIRDLYIRKLFSYKNN